MAKRRPVGGMILWCRDCETYFSVKGADDRTCPSCKRYVSVMRCSRCGHTWTPRRSGIPATCPECGSPYWNRRRLLPKADKGGEE